MYDDRKRRDVRLLLAADVPQERVAQQLGVSLRTVQRVAREMRQEPRAAEGAEEAVPAAQGPSRTGPGRPSVLEAYRDTVARQETWEAPYGPREMAGTRTTGGNKRSGPAPLPVGGLGAKQQASVVLAGETISRKDAVRGVVVSA